MRGSVDKMVREPFSEKMMFECKSQRREQTVGISGGRQGSGLELQRGLMFLRTREELRVAGGQLQGDW